MTQGFHMKMTFLLIASVIAAVPAYAQDTLKTANIQRYYNPVKLDLLGAASVMPADKYGFKPTPVQMTVGNVAEHLEFANYLLCTIFSGTPHPETAKDSLPDSVKALWPKDTLVARLRASFTFCKAAFDKVSDANLADSVATGAPFRAKKNVRARLVILFMTDLVDHYSQMANYMRAMGMTPPSSYPPPKK